MACGSVQNVKIEPMELRWRIEAADRITIPLTTVGSDLDGKYFIINSGGNVTEHYFWFDTGSSVDPAPAGRTGISVSILATDDAATIEDKLQTAVDGEADYVATSDTDSTNVLLIERVTSLETDAAADGDSGFSFDQCSKGGDLEIGLTDGDLEWSLEEQTLDLTAHQTGPEPLSKLRQGKTASVSVTLKETDAAKINELLAATAGSVNDEGGANEIYGWGSSKQGTNVIVDARRLELHPAGLGAADLSRDWVFWKTYPTIDGITFSGENPHQISLTFTAFTDSTKPDPIDFFVYGANWKGYVAI